MAHRFFSFCDRFSDHFRTQTRSVVAQSRQYLSGLMQARRKNMERMAEVVADSDAQSLQHFLSQSPWSHRDVLDQVASEADARLGGYADSALLIDESAITKKGRHSVPFRTARARPDSITTRHAVGAPGIIIRPWWQWPCCLCSRSARRCASTCRCSPAPTSNSSWRGSYRDAIAIPMS